MTIPILEVGEPLGAGLSRALTSRRGGTLSRGQSFLSPPCKARSFPSRTGFWARTNAGHIVAHIKTRAPNLHLQETNQLLGLDSVYAVTTDRYLSVDASRPTVFSNANDYIFPPGTRLFNIMSGAYVVLQFETAYHSEFTARRLFLLASSRANMWVMGSLDS